MDKFEILESNGENIMEFIGRLFDENADRDTALLNISHYFGGTVSYITDNTRAVRNNIIQKIFNEVAKEMPDKKKATQYRVTAQRSKEEISKSKFPMCNITHRIVCHAIEGA